MENTYKLCIILFLIFVVIHLLDNNDIEFLTQNEVAQETKNVISNYNNNTAINAQNQAVSKNVDSNSVIVPDGIKYGGSSIDSTNGSDFSNEATKLGVSKLDTEPINYYDTQMKDTLQKKNFNAGDFLPQEINEDWFNTDLTKAQNEIDQSTLIDISKFCQGVDTVGQSLKNPSYDIRGNIPNPKITVSPFLNSSYEPDTNIRSWC